jgi:fucokinase
VFDGIVLTASNPGQARAYAAQLARRGLGADSAPAAMVVPDPAGRRVGSGLSTLLALARLAERFGDPGSPGPEGAFLGRRLCVLHAGGDSRRLPAYAALGKAFTPLPLAGRGPEASALFDLLLSDLAGLDLPEEGRVVVATGDVYLGLASTRPAMNRPGITGVAWPDTPARGSRHGVYRAGPGGEVTGFLHKPTPERAAGAGAIRADGRVLIDTGVVSLDPASAAAWLRAAGAGKDGRARPGGLLSRAAAGSAPALDLYADVLGVLAGEGARSPEAASLAGPALSVSVVDTCPFMHIGTSRELLEVMTAPGSPAPGWSACEGGVRVVRSRVGPVRAGGRVWIEGCDLREPPDLAGENILVGVPGGAAGRVELGPGWGLVCVPVEGGRWAAVCFGIDDDFKTPLESGGTFGGMPLEEWIDRAGIDPASLWPPGTPRTLWHARLWTTTDEPGVLGPVSWMLRGSPAPPAWAAGRRLSAGEVMASADHARLIEARDRVAPVGP